ncbi:MAG: DNA polymerase I [Bacilli bacterium]
MEKIVLIDGNNLLFRSYYATAYNGKIMKNSKEFPTNALFGFTNMINKIVMEEKPVYIIVAFDLGKTFRHEKYKDYKACRIKMPDELKVQFPIAKQLLTYMGIKYYEIENYEADDIIGTFARYCDEDEKYIGTIISSDKDLLQLISSDVSIKLLRQKDYIRYDEASFKEAYGIEPIKIIDLKALMGDPSDNIPGVKGIGEKTALKLLQDYQNLDNIYANIDKISPKLQEKLLTDKENAYLSYELATIIKEVPMTIKIKDIKYQQEDTENLHKLYEDLEFYSFLKKAPRETAPNLEITIINDIDEINITKDSAIYLEIFKTNYHHCEILGMGVYNNEESCYIPFEILKQKPGILNSINKYTYDIKKVYTALKWYDITIEKINFDTMIAAFLLDYNVKDDIAYLANMIGYNIDYYENIYGKKNKEVKPTSEIVAYNALLKAKFIYETHDKLVTNLKEKCSDNLFYDIEIPLTYTLADMEYNGVYVNKKILQNMGEEIKNKLEHISREIYNFAGKEFNISSPSQLGQILFEHLQLPHSKKGKTGYSTAVDVLKKLVDKHPIIKPIMEHRVLSKLYTTYIEGLLNAIMDDGKIHTIYNQTLTRTGRLSSVEPNLQNIPYRTEYGKSIRKAFIPSPNFIIITADYSQIELRILAHIAHIDTLIEAFKNNLDIHTKTASDVFNVPLEEVTKQMRRTAKAVNFGIIYGISSYGLSENLSISPKEAGNIIENYLNTYPGIKEYMENTIRQAHEKGYVKTLSGRTRYINELQNSNHMIRNSGERMALNTPIQGTSADIIKKAMIEINESFKKNKLKSKMILQVHDELIFDTLETEVQQVKTIVKQIMENTFKLSVPLKIDIQQGNDWYQAK